MNGALVYRLVARGVVSLTEASTSASINDVHCLWLWLDAEAEAEARAAAKAQMKS